jgi:two-component system, chemotaxis family, chemotaxis protein CheY
MDFAVALGSSLPPKRLRILCAEDQAQMSDLLRNVLERAGHEVVCVTDGREAWDRIRANPGFFDAIVTDHQMPHVTGLELVGRLRELGFAGKIIVQSAKVSATDQVAFERLGIHQIVAKPAGFLDLPKLI